MAPSLIAHFQLPSLRAPSSCSVEQANVTVAIRREIWEFGGESLCRGLALALVELCGTRTELSALRSEGKHSPGSVCLQCLQFSGSCGVSSDNISLHKWPIRIINDVMCSKGIDLMILFTYGGIASKNSFLK